MDMSGKFKVVITDCDHPSVDEEREVLKELDAEVVLAQCKTEDEVISVARDADGILNQYAPITQKVINSLERCKVIARYGVGVDSVDVDAATERGIIVANVPDYCVDEVSSHAIALLMACARKVVFLDRYVGEKRWDVALAAPIFRLQGKVLGLYGLGRLGFATARKAKGLGLHAIAYDPYVQRSDEVELVSFEDLLKRSDFVSIHAPLTKETRHTFGEAALRLMKKTAYLINTSRGPLVDEAALCKALKEGWIAGAAIDVMEHEPPDWNNPLFSVRDKLIVTPHAAYYSEESYVELKRKTALAVAKTLKGGRPDSVVNRAVLEKA